MDVPEEKDSEEKTNSHDDDGTQVKFLNILFSPLKYKTRFLRSGPSHNNFLW
jgi:hypothetical protein